MMNVSYASDRHRFGGSKRCKCLSGSSQFEVRQGGRRGDAGIALVEVLVRLRAGQGRAHEADDPVELLHTGALPMH